ncbi:MAG: S-layer homology domain-containing protein [Oscillospiraceae bacterium]|nr:S-layer homology domain-containing protein [Oscillospiraceae bacterium]
MKRLLTRGLAFLLALSLLLGCGLTALAASDDELQDLITESAEFLLGSVDSPQVGSVGGEWLTLGLARSGAAVPQDYWDGYYAAAEDYVAACGGVLHERKYTEYSRLILALTAIGASPEDVAGYNLLTPLGDYDKTVWQGINGAVWALLALDSRDYPMPQNAEAETQATRQMYVDYILSRCLPDGGWSLTGSDADPDVTAMALQALAKYTQQDAAAQAVEAGLECLSAMQNADGGFSSMGSANAESCAQVIVALCELGISLDDERFVKNGCTLLDNLLTYRLENGGFKHTAGESEANMIASEQAFYALAAAERALEGKNSLYRMSDALPLISNTVFADVQNHEKQTAIEALAARGILNGRDDGLFHPDDSITRAEFAAVMVRGLDLETREGSTFSDVNSGDWFASAVGTASAYGIVNGVGGGAFAPEGTLTVQAAAVMLARAAELCGMDTQTDGSADGLQSADWARSGLAFCLSAGILDADIDPTAAATRCEVAQMLYNLLQAAEKL